MAFGGHIEYFISTIKVMCTAINKALKVCKFQLPTIGVHEPNLRKNLIKCTKWRLTAMLDLKLKKNKSDGHNFRWGPICMQNFSFLPKAVLEILSPQISAGKKKE